MLCCGCRIRIPMPIAAGEIGLNLMGDGECRYGWIAPIAPFATYRLSVAELLPDGALAAADRDSRRQAFRAPALRSIRSAGGSASRIPMSSARI